jgi:SAM-dependent methyltransferase
MSRPDDAIVAHYDRCLRLHGDTAQGANWPNEDDRRRRFDVMLGIITGPGVLCDFGCGTGELLTHVRRKGLDLSYFGVDRSRHAIAYARNKFPGTTFLELDALAQGDLSPLDCDYLVANGVFTVRASVSQQDMWLFLTETVSRLWPHVRKGMAFNVMSKHVDWERDDLFHLPFDQLAVFLHKLAGRNIAFRADYGLYEYTAYVFKAA